MTTSGGRPTHAVELDGVAQRLGARWVLRGVTLAVPRGELVAMTGHNGSGKTTLLRVVATALRATRGTVRVLGRDVQHEPDAARDAIAMLASGGGSYGDLSAAENLQFAQRMWGDDHDRAAVLFALERVGLHDVSDARVRTFSSGMQRRLALARLFLRPASLLLLDEPYNSLDTAGAALVDELLDETRARGGSAIVVVHEPAHSGIAFDRTLELRDGYLARDVRRVRATEWDLREPAEVGA